MYVINDTLELIMVVVGGGIVDHQRLRYVIRWTCVASCNLHPKNKNKNKTKDKKKQSKTNIN